MTFDVLFVKVAKASKIEGSIYKRVIKENKLNEDWYDESWSLYNDGIDYGGKIKDIVRMGKKYDIVNIRLDRIGEGPSYDSNERERASKADYTKYPIVAVDLGINGVGVLDGNHRVFQAREDGETKLKGHLIPLEDIEKYKLK